MSIPVSTVPAVKTYLLQTLTAALVAEPGRALTVCLDDPGIVQTADVVSVGQVHTRRVTAFQMIGSLGAGALYENYRMTITCSVFRAGLDQAWPFQRAYNLASAVENAVRTDPTLGGNVLVAMPADSHDQSEWEAEHKGRIVDVVIELDIQAQI